MIIISLLGTVIPNSIILYGRKNTTLYFRSYVIRVYTVVFTQDNDLNGIQKILYKTGFFNIIITLNYSVPENTEVFSVRELTDLFQNIF